MKRRMNSIFLLLGTIGGLALLAGCDGSDDEDNHGNSLLNALKNLQLNVTVDQNSPTDTTIVIWPTLNGGGDHHD